MQIWFRRTRSTFRRRHRVCWPGNSHEAHLIPIGKWRFPVQAGAHAIPIFGLGFPSINTPDLRFR